ncbi:NADP-dependent oxidoreductase [Desemzia sp. RIT804]|uniref:NADP-dependent oxidoreductase n=1 Tax=Desemzia sp. RIT 804 TaxID=2810209 RepID=UPI0019513D78|nr:NADP-dependent oxidoreductase [Desemzia sp. RIT 804]MBM6613699.1 NADP-dependent oxidoreductase [Desemzia sp. RIT 804]
MKAIVINQYGSADELVEQEVPLPEIKDDQVLIELKATSINPIDWKMREGYLKEKLPYEFPIILGWDAAGIVKKVGKDVTNFQLGEKVFARPKTNPTGTYAEYVAVDQDLICKMPENSSFNDAAAIPLTGQTAWAALVEIGQIKEGDHVLIHGGSGGVGHLAIQIAKHFGAYIAATASEKNEDFVKSLGADEFINYKEQDFETLLNDYDIVLDTQGGETQEKSFSVLKHGGTLVSIATPPDEEKAAEKGIKTGYFFLEPDGERLQKLADLMKSNKLKATIGKTLPFTQEGLREAHRTSEEHGVPGKIVVQMNE